MRSPRLSRYPHQTRAAANGGEAGRPARAEGRCVMGTTPSGPGSSLSEVRFLTVAEVAGAMRVSKMTVYRLVKAGELPAVRFGRSYRVPEQAMHDYLRAAFIEAG